VFEIEAVVSEIIKEEVTSAFLNFKLNCRSL
jgi:hypothetical protein